MGTQNFDPEWAKHLKHDPDKPLAINVPVPTMGWKECRASFKPDEGDKTEAVQHIEERRPKVQGQEHGAVSNTWINIHLSIHGSDEEMNLTVQTSTEVWEVAERIGYKAGIDPLTIKWVEKRGCSYRKMSQNEQVARKMTMTGIKSFSKQKVKWPHPKVIIGAGHMGLRMALRLCEFKDFNFVVFDRMFRVGGTSWMYQANSTSKLQTEFGAYHLAFGEDYPIPTYFTTPWPSRNALLNMFQSDVEKYGVMPYIRLNTNVKFMEIQSKGKEWTGPKSLAITKYDLTLESMKEGRLKYGKLVAASDDNVGEESTFAASCLSMFPGNLTIPRKEEYKGEDEFDGDIGYAMFNEINYHELEGKNVTIVGHGAFAVENIRTCCEFGVSQIFLVCRRLNLACPRVASWMANRGMMPIKNARYMVVTEHMYNLIELDPWSYHSVAANEKRTTCSITQKARFGIGDIYFLSIYMGKVKICLDKEGVKRVSHHCVHLHDGERLECEGILKLLGLVGEMDIDRLMRVKEMVGFWANGDPRRYILAEPLSVMCSNMGGTSFSPGAYVWAIEGVYFQDFPQEFDAGPLASGLLPKHTSDLTDEHTPRPAYVVDARHGTGTSMAIQMSCPGVMEQEQTAGYVKAIRHRLCHPIGKFLAQAKQDWDYYAEKMLAEGFGTEKPYPTYPYTVDVVTSLYTEHMMETYEPPLLCDGPDIELAKQIAIGDGKA